MSRSARIHRIPFNTATWVYIILALVLGLIVPGIEGVLPPAWDSPVSKSTIETILGAIASGMITLSGLVFSLFFVLVQFGSVAYSPRITALFANSRTLHHSLGIFTGTFLFALMALRSVGMSDSQRVSYLPVWMAAIWLLGSIVILAQLVRVFATMTITNMLRSLGRVGQRSIARNYGAYSPGKPNVTAQGVLSTRERQGYPLREIIFQGEPAYITGINRPALISIARASGSVIAIPYAIGDAVKVGLPLALISGEHHAGKETAIIAAIELGHIRALMNDPKFPIRLLVDIGIRALSPAINDPTTAVQALDQIEPLLHQIGNSDLDTGLLRDREGVIRLLVKTPNWEDYLQLGLAEIMQYGASSLQVERRLEAVLVYLLKTVPPGRAAAVHRFREQRRAIASVSFEDATFRQWADLADREGIGSGMGNRSPFS